MTEDSFKTFNWKPELRKKFFTKEQQSPEKLLFPDLRMKSGIQNLVRQKFQQILDTQTKIGFRQAISLLITTQIHMKENLMKNL